MTDITELAQREKFEAWFKSSFHPDKTGPYIKDQLYFAWKAAGAELVEALEYYKSREERVTSLVRDNSKSWDELYRQVEAKGKRNVELVEALESEKRICATWRKTAKSTGEKLEKAQTINAAAEKLVRCKGRYHSEQNYRSLAALFGVTTPDLPPLEHENVHYADAAEMEIAALRQRIAELESRTVKLPDLRQIVSGDRYVWSDGVYNYSQDVKVALAAAGIKVEAE
ncbi:ead/Ea22-like family protein [Klebsiella pneumoniae]|uniref:ead/Ea22-like family protein n=1 Tax=Klebsiella pneumoniae TaxID=573 RepID=UPI00388F338C